MFWNFNISQNHKLTLLGVYSDDHISSNKEIAIDNAMIVFGNQDIYQNTTGINWQALWGSNAYSNTSFAFTSSKYKEDYYETATEDLLIRNRSHEQVFKIRNNNLT